MRLTPIDRETLPRALAHMRAALPVVGPSRAAFDTIARTVAAFDDAYDTPDHRAQAVSLAGAFGIPLIDAAPATAFSWDGAAIRTRSEASVLVHEVAHWLICPVSRRHLPDFGLGAGPETGRIADADAARCVSDNDKEHEELMASLLGILWEAALGQPAIHAFVEQNWLEAWQRPAAAGQFRRTVDDLFARGLVGAGGRPYAGNATTAEISIRNSGQASAETSTMAEAGPSLGK